MTVTKVHMTEEKALEQDVKTMSYEELMESIRFLDEERKKITERNEILTQQEDNSFIVKKKKVA